MNTARQRLGAWGENLAASYLEDRGYTILQKNARTPYGEIDLVAQTRSPDGGRVIVFVEVKTRTNTTYGQPEEAITAHKREHMFACAQAYLQAHPELDGDWRLDVIAVLRTTGNQPAEITHFENAIN